MRGRSLCARAFPGAWRERYGSELLALLAEEDRPAWAQCVDLLWAGARERVASLRLPAVPRPVGILAPAALAAVSVAAVAVVPATITPTTPGPARARVSRRVVIVGGVPAAGRSPIRRARSAPGLADRGVAVVTLDASRGHVLRRATRVQRDVLRIVRLRSAGDVSGKTTGAVLSRGAGS